MTKNALVTAEIDEETVEKLRSMGYQTRLAGWGQTRTPLDEVEFMEMVPDVSLLVVEVEKVTQAVIQAAAELSVIHVCRAGAGIVDLEAASARGIPVLTSPARNADSVAEFTLGMMLTLSRGIAAAADHLRHEGWYVNGEIPYFHFRGPELCGRSIGLVGCGAIGRALLQRLRGFDMEVLIFDPYIPSEDKASLGKDIDLPGLMTSSDFVIVLCPLNDETRGMIDGDMLSMMSPSSYLINPARAAVVEEQALLTALQELRIAGAALDVFWEEPIQKGSPWLKLSNVLLTPHIAGASMDVRVHQGHMLVEDLQVLNAGGQPTRLVNPDVLRK